MSFPIPDFYIVTIGVNPADTYARRLRNTQRLLRPAPYPIENVRIPARDGRRPRPIQIEQSAPFELIWDIDGRVDDEGEKYEDDRAGLLANLEAFLDDIYRQTRDSDGCLAVGLTSGFGPIYTGRVQFADCDFTDGLWQCEARVQCVNPDGELTQLSSS